MTDTNQRPYTVDSEEIAPAPSEPTPRVSRTVSILSRRKSLWKMVRSMLLPHKLLTSFVCGSSAIRSRRVKRRLRRDIKSTWISESSIPRPSEEEAAREIELEIPPPQEDSYSEQISTRLASLSIREQEVQVQVEPEQLQDNPGSDAHIPPTGSEVILRRKKERPVSASWDPEAFHGWRKSSIDVTSEPPLTLKWIPSGLQIGDKVVWLSEENDQPEPGQICWIGKIRSDYYAGVELDRPLGNSSGLYGYGSGLVTRLFECPLSHGKFIPISQLILHTDYYDKGIKAGFICIICRDDFLELPDQDQQEQGMVATRCGHLYHQQCIQQWFGSGQGQAKRPKRCPHCQKQMTEEDVIKLFPAKV